MKQCSNVLIAFALSVGFMGQSYAAGSEQGNRPQGGPPPFSSIDSDGDGEISYSEFSSQEIPHGDHQTIFDEMDSDSNGVVSEEEFNSFKPPRPSRD